MPLLAGYIGSLFSGIFGFFASWMTKRIAIVAAAVTAVLAVTSAFIASAYTIIGGIAASVPSWLAISASWVVPYNFEACLGAYVAAYILKWGYDWNVRVIQFKLL